MEFVLILFISIGMLSDKDSMTITNVPFKSKEECVVAGQAAKHEFDKGTKEVKFVCVSRKI